MRPINIVFPLVLMVIFLGLNGCGSSTNNSIDQEGATEESQAQESSTDEGEYLDHQAPSSMVASEKGDSVNLAQVAERPNQRNETAVTESQLMSTPQRAPRTPILSSKPDVIEDAESLTGQVGNPLVTQTQPSASTSIKAPGVKKEQKIKVMPPPSHMIWDQLLSTYVTREGKVNYKGFVGAKKQLNEYLDLLNQQPVEESWTSNQIMAYWINAYNAFTIKLIVDNYPLKSIKDLHGGNPWDVAWIDIGGKKYSLNQIENDLLRPVYKDPRIHFAVNCAAKSCPPLLNKAWTANTLELYFEQQAKSFINNSAYNEIGAETASVSKIFDWYKSDFGDLIKYLNGYSEVLINEDATLKFKEYNWALNE